MTTGQKIEWLLATHPYDPTARTTPANGIRQLRSVDDEKLRRKAAELWVALNPEWTPEQRRP